MNKTSWSGAACSSFMDSIVLLFLSLLFLLLTFLWVNNVFNSFSKWAVVQYSKLEQFCQCVQEFACTSIYTRQMLIFTQFLMFEGNFTCSFSFFLFHWSTIILNNLIAMGWFDAFCHDWNLLRFCSNRRFCLLSYSFGFSSDHFCLCLCIPVLLALDF